MVRCGVGLILGVHCLAASAHASEAGLRVAFVYNFLKFIEWPEHQGEEFKLCALGVDPATRQSLEKINNKPLQHRRINVVYLDTQEAIEQTIGSCPLLYVPRSGAGFILPQPFPAGVLLVADEASANDQVGISLQRTADNRIEFVMNEPALQHAGVKVSSQLLKLAKSRQGGGG
jgi:hypothetical protein